MIEINIRLDFSSDNVFPDGNNLGHVGEHNATALTVTPPPEMAANENIAFYCLAFEVGNDFIKKIVRSALIPKADTFDVKLWKQATISENFKIQLEAYDGENSLLIKTDYAEAVLSPSINGVQANTDTRGQSLAGTVAAHEAKLADFSTDENGNLLYKGKAVSSDRPTATTRELDMFLAISCDSPRTECFMIVDINGSLPEIPIGTEIKTIETKIGENGEWVDIHKMYEVDGQPYVLHMNRVYDGDSVSAEKAFAIVAPTYFGPNYLYAAIQDGSETVYVRITYYTDSLGGENNA